MPGRKWKFLPILKGVCKMSERDPRYFKVYQDGDDRDLEKKIQQIIESGAAPGIDTQARAEIEEIQRAIENGEIGGGSGVDQKAREDIQQVTEQLADTVKEVNGVKPKNGKVTLPIPEVDTSNLRLKTEKISQIDISEELLQQMAGNTPINAVPADKSITPQKTSFINFIGTEIQEYNEITKATVVNSIAELQASNKNALLAGHANKFNGTLETSTSYNVMKLFVKAGDVIRSKIAPYGLSARSASTLYYITFFDSSNKLVSAQLIYGNAHANANITALKENGTTAPANAAYCYINIYGNYINSTTEATYTNGRTAEIITINKDRSLTRLESLTSQQADYTPVGNNDGEAHFEVNQDIRIPRYEERFGDIESILASIVEV